MSLLFKLLARLLAHPPKLELEAVARKNQFRLGTSQQARVQLTGKHIVEVRHEHVYRQRRKPEGTPAKNRGWFKPKTPSPAAAELVDA